MSTLYEPVKKHWFYKETDDKWMPFTHIDSERIQKSYIGNGPEIIATDSGRYDVNITNKTRIPIYWKCDINEIRLCSWFHITFNNNYTPYEEHLANILEDEYKNAIINNKWNIKIQISDDEIILFQTPKKLLHYSDLKDTIKQNFWNELAPTRIVKRGIDKLKIESGNDYNNKNIDHLIFVVPGISSGTLLKFRSDIEAVNRLRINGCQLIKTHFEDFYENNKVGIIEVLPVPWQGQIHSPNSKIDDKLNTITLESLPKFRKIANHTILDVLSYTSPFFCQNIMNTVGNLINENYIKFCKRNPNFNGTISLAGHSLGGLILFDLLCNQKHKSHNNNNNNKSNNNLTVNLTKSSSSKYFVSGTGQKLVNYPQLLFEPKICFALGSPIGFFVALRNTDCLGLDFKLPTCSNFYNIFHPYDPIAYRIEGLINPDLAKKRPVQIPYHKGGIRKHLEFKETMTRVKNDLKQKVFVTYTKIFDKISSTPSTSSASASGSASSSSATNEAERNQEIQKDVDDILQFQTSLDDNNKSTLEIDSDVSSLLDNDIKFGNLNNSKRIDYVLQAGPLEVINEYLFALNSHVGYWESEDTMLFVVKELYSTLGITPEMHNI